jgi:hypothetical protein
MMVVLFQYRFLFFRRILYAPSRRGMQVNLRHGRLSAIMAAMKQGNDKTISREATTRRLLDDWHFGGVPDDEKEACYLYEYAREFFKSNKHLQKFYEEWKKPAKKGSGQNYIAWIKALDLLRTRCENFPRIDFDYFPKVAWQDLPRKWPLGCSVTIDLRRESADDVNEWSKRFRKSRFDRLNMATLRELEPARMLEQEVQSVEKSYQKPQEQYAERLLREFEPPKDHLLTIFKKRHEWVPWRKLLGETEYGFFAIDWGYRDTEIRRAFGEWLEDQRQVRKKLGLSDDKPAPSRGGFADRLNWLGALRVKNHFRKKDLVDYNDTNLKVDAPYSHYPDLCENANRAKKEIARLFTDDWSEKEWRRKQREQAKRPRSLPEFLK